MNTIPLKEGVSWEGHLSGLIVGLIFALIFKKQIAKPKRYVWEDPNFNEEEDDFIKQFDKNGNFIEPVKEVEEELTKDDNLLSINYTFKENKDL